MNELQWGLERPFPVEAIHWRVGSLTRNKDKASALAYIDARDAMERLDEVVGPERWQCRYTTVSGDLMVCEVGIKIEGEWVWKANAAGETKVEGEKGMASDAFKRAAVLWGIGRYLYSLPTVWVPTKNERYLAEVPTLPAWATPEGWKGASFNPLILHNNALRDNLGSVLAVKEGIQTDQLSTAKEAWAELEEDTQRALWVAITKGGILTTEERRIMKSPEWIAA